MAFLDEIVKRQIRDLEMCAFDASLTSNSPSFDAPADDLAPTSDAWLTASVDQADSAA